MEIRTPRLGAVAQFHTRDGTSDGALIHGIVGEDEYDLASLPRLYGTAIDVGAHIGGVTIALALDHPGLRVIAIEPVPENVEYLLQNIAANHLEHRVTVIEAAAADGKPASLTYGYTKAGDEPSGYVHDNRFIGNMYGKLPDAQTMKVQSVTLEEVVGDLPDVCLMKIDCEGCEWKFLASPAVKLVDRIIGEYHDGPRSDGIRSRIGETHDIRFAEEGEDVELFWAKRR